MEYSEKLRFDASEIEIKPGNKDYVELAFYTMEPFHEVVRRIAEWEYDSEIALAIKALETEMGKRVL